MSKTKVSKRFSYGERVVIRSSNVAKKYQNKKVTVNHHFNDNRVLLMTDDGNKIGVWSTELERA